MEASGPLAKLEQHIAFDEGYRVGRLHTYNQEQFLRNTSLDDMQRLSQQKKYNELFNQPPWDSSSTAENL